MPLTAGEQFDSLARIPEASRPTTPTADIENLPGGQGTRHAARTSEDGTRWCLTCLFTLTPAGQESFCPTCKRMRQNFLQGIRRRDNATRVGGSVSIPGAAIHELVAQSRKLERYIGQLMAARRHGEDEARAQSRLNDVSKELTLLIDNEFLPAYLQSSRRGESNRRP